MLSRWHQRRTECTDVGHVQLTVTERVTVITVNDPDGRNAVTEEISAGLRAAIAAELFGDRNFRQEQ
jgi:hypothetical protein